MNSYRTKDGDRIDLICWKHYGSIGGRVVEQVLSANPGISVSAEFKSGTLIRMPELRQEVGEPSLW